MATTRLSDIIDVTVFRDLPPVDGPEKTAFFESGIVTRNALLDELAGAAGKTAELPFWKDLDGSSEVNYSDDDPSNTATPEKLVQGEQVARKAFVNKGWQAADLASELALGARAMDRIRGRTDAYFRKQWQRRLIATTNGLIADNVANDGGDMVVDVASESISGQDAGTRFNRDAFVEANFTMGDAQGELSAMAVHSAVYAQMVKNDDVEFIPDSQGNLTIPTYLGIRVIVDDGMPAETGDTDGIKYTSALFGAGAFGYGEGNPEVSVEVERYADQANGGGIESLWVRNSWLLHPFGYQAVGTPSNGLTFTQSELEAAGTIDRVIDRKLVPMAFLVTN